jgi:nicotinate-nucleotide adenylyltransferase
MADSQKIALFGGTFDPVHEGHLEIATKAVKQLGLDRVIFIPCRRSPHKTDLPGASDSDRLRMLALATATLPWAVAEDYELQKPPPSFTWETVRHFKEELPPKTRLFLLIGFDQWENLPRWNNVEALTADLEFIVVGRSQNPQSREGYQAHFIEGSHPASASEIREILALGKAPRWLSAPVLDYISEKDLYSPAP